MSLDWQYTTRSGITMVTLTGHLGGDAVARFTGAVDFLLARSRGPILIDATGLISWSEEGRTAILTAARQFAEQGRTLAACATGPLFTSWLAADSLAPLATYPDQASALRALAAPA